MKTLPLPAAALAALLLTAACGSGSEQPAATADPAANDQAAMSAAPPAAAPVALPPALIASRTYRCKDNSLVYVDFYGDNVSADLRPGTKDAPVVKLTAPEAGQALSGGGFTVSGGNGTQVTIAQPGKGSQSCKA